MYSVEYESSLYICSEENMSLFSGKNLEVTFSKGVNSVFPENKVHQVNNGLDCILINFNVSDETINKRI